MTTNERVILYLCVIFIAVMAVDNIIVHRSQREFNHTVAEALYTFCGKQP